MAISKYVDETCPYNKNKVKFLENQKDFVELLRLYLQVNMFGTKLY